MDAANAVPPQTSTIPAPAADSALADGAIEGLQEYVGILAANSATAWTIFAVAIIVGTLGGRILAAVLRRLGGEDKEKNLRAYSFHAIAAPLTLLCTAIGIDVGIRFLQMPDGLRSGADQSLLFIYIVSFFWFLLDLAGYIDVVVRRRSEKTGGNYGQHLGPAIRKALRIFLVVLALLVVVDSVFRQDIGAWLAGFGVAGLAISLAAQDTFKSFFGAITIFADHPFKVGQRIVYGGHDGIVEDIGFRSVKIRTLVGHLVTVPNANIVSDAVQNIGERPYIRRLFTVNVTYDTSPAKLRQALEIIKGILAADDMREPIHQTINGDEFPPRVYLSELSSYSIDIMVIYWFAPPLYWDYLDHAEQVNLRIVEQFNDAGIDFAFPSQTLYHAGDPNRELRMQIDRETGATSPAH